MKRYKIVKKDNAFTLYERNRTFVIGLTLFPLTTVLGVLFIVLPNDNIALLFFFLLVLIGGFNISLLATLPYSKKEMFLDEDKLHQYIAEQRLLDKKPTVYYLD